MAAFPGMHSPLLNIAMCDYQTDTETGDGQSDPYEPLCFAGNTEVTKFQEHADLQQFTDLWCFLVLHVLHGLNQKLRIFQSFYFFMD